MDPAENFVPEGKPQAERGNVAPEARPEKTSSNSFSIPDIQAMTSRIAGKMNQERTEKFDPTAPKEEAPGFPEAQDPVSGKGVSVKENGGQAPTPEPPAGSKTPAREEAQIPPPLAKDSASSNLAREFPTTSQEEKEGLPLSGTRHGQVPPSGKESQTLSGLYGASAESAAVPLGGAEKMAGGREAPAPMRLESQGIYQQVGERVVWLIRNQEERIRMSLDPPELGHLFLEIHRTKENIQTTLYTDNPVTKVTLESNQREIQRIIESEGFKMEKFDVLVQQDLSRFQERKDSPFHSDSRSSLVSGNIEAPVSSAPDSFSSVPRRMHSGSRYLDLFV
jgi:flagellar hook-length control protein FliK